jgi:hypothetical protein
MSRKNNRYAALLLAAGLGMGACASIASAKADTVELNKVPEAARRQILQASAGGTKVNVYDLGPMGNHKDVFMAHYTDASGKRMEIKVDEDGAVVSQGETQGQRRKDAQAKLDGAKTDAERAQVESELQAQRDAEDQQSAMATTPLANEAQPANARISPTAAPPSLSGRASVNAPALDEKDLSEEYNSKDRAAVPATSIPAVVKKTLDMETLGTKNIDYYKYTVDGKTFYSAHYDLGPEQRDIARVNDSGKLVGKNDLTPAADATDKAPAARKPAK